ncbi:hypothetical protein [Nostoc sp.]|uniref:hypothetical protein n=1 Tax=Nostoc sp. TaxID=1180 RepID=UPI002FF91508
MGVEDDGICDTFPAERYANRGLRQCTHSLNLLQRAIACMKVIANQRCLRRATKRTHS